MKKTLLFTSLIIALGVAQAKSGLEIGTDSQANGKGSISTGKNSIAIGTGAVATGDNLTGPVISDILLENKNQLEQIDSLKKLIASSEKEYAEKLEVWERVDRANKAIAENNKTLSEKLNPELNNLNADYANFKPEHDAIVSDMNNRLDMISKLDFKIIGEDPKEGLNKLADKLKSEVEDGYDFSLDQSFYRNYIDNYMEELGNANKIRKELNENRYFLTDSNGVELWVKSTSLNDGWEIKDKKVRLNDGSKKSAYAERKEGNSITQSEYDNWLEEQESELNTALTIIKNYEHSFITEEERNKMVKTTLDYFEVQKQTQLSNLYLNEYYEASDKYGKDSPEAITALQKRAEAINTYESIAENFDSLRVGTTKRTELEDNLKNIEKGNTESKKTLQDEFNKAIADTTNRYNKLNKEIEAKEAEIAKIERENAQLKPSDKEIKEAELVDSVKAKLEADKNALAKALDDLKLNDLTDIGENAIAIGHNTLTTGKNAIGMGADTIVTGENGVGIGNSVLVTGENGIAIGSNSSALEKNALALGFASLAMSENSTAIGANAQASGKNSVALGSNSIAKKDNEVSVGNDTLKRKITNVDLADLSENSSDAVVGSQLNETNVKVDTNTQGIADNKQSIADTNVKVDANTQGVADNKQSIADTNVKVDANTQGVTDNKQSIADTNVKVDANTQGVADNKQSIADTNVKVDANTQGVTDNKQSIADTNVKVDANTQGVADNKQSIADTNVKVDANTQGVADNKKAIADTNLRVDSLESGLRDTNLNVEINTQGVADNKKAIADTNIKVDTNTQGIANNKKAILDTNIKVDSNTKTISEMTTKVDANTQGVADNKQSIADTNVKVDANTQGIADNKQSIADTNVKVDVNTQGIADNKQSIADTNVKVDANTQGVTDNKQSIADTNVKVSDNKIMIMKNADDITKHFGGKAYLDDDGNIVAPAYEFSDKTFNNVGDSLSYLDKKIDNSSGLFVVDGNQITIRKDEKTQSATIVNIGDRKMTGVMKGNVSEDSTDAINGSQLWATNQAVNQNERDIRHINNTMNYYGNRIQQIERTVKENRKLSSAGIAGAMAMGSIPYVDHAKYSFGMGMATYDGESAISMGLTWRFNGDRSRFRVNASYDSQDKLGVGLGVAFEL